jgi:tRNA threonylcarbamoyladenosine biosynthesis protein TsaB
MNTILCLETSGLGCSVAISQNGDCKAFKYVLDEQYRHAEVLHTLTSDVLAELSIDLKKLDAIAVSQGPGSYTGLRVGVSAAKGFCYALEIPLIAVNTLEIIAIEAKKMRSENANYLAMIDARRDEVFMQEFDSELSPLTEPKPVILAEYTPPPGINIFCGDGAKKAENHFKNKVSTFLSDIRPLASTMCKPAFDLWEKKKFVDVAYFEPFYLKEFFTGK